MPRQARIDIPGCIYHVIGRGIERRMIFRDHDDRVDFLRRLEKGLTDTSALCYAWVLMDNHFHLLLRPLKDPLSHLMRKVLTGYVLYYNAKYRRVGHLYQNRYKSILCQEDVYFLELVRYIHLNPVRAGMIQTPGELARWRWSGHRGVLWPKKVSWQATDEVLRYFHSRRREAVSRYNEFIKAGWGIGYRKDLVGGGLQRSAQQVGGINALRQLKERWRSDSQVLGDGDFVTGILKETGQEQESREKMRKKYDLDKIGVIVCKEFGIKQEELYSGRRLRSISTAKGLYAYLANEVLGESLVRIAEKLKMSSSGATFKARMRGEKYVRENGSPIRE